MSVIKLIVIAFLFCAIYAKDEPKFVGPGSNTTVVVGRDATLTCRVDNLNNYKVAWLRVDTQTILTIGPHVITKNHRVGVTRSDSQVWTLLLRDVRLSDGGQYMCQVNTEPMITQTYDLHVSVPPDIVDSGSSEVMVREGDNVTLFCAASGTPQPSITWRREDSAQMIIESKSVVKWSGKWLNMTSVGREMNGAFLCIAKNGVPPSVSKRILLHVFCSPTVRVTQKMIGGYQGDSLIMKCYIEAHPAPVVYWTHMDNNRLQNGSKYQASVKSNGYKHTAILKLNNISRDDIGTYHCNTENSLGTARDVITLYTLATTTVTTTTVSESPTEELSYTADISTTPIQPYAELEAKEDEKHLSEQDDVVVILSQQQMQNLDLSPSS